MYGASPEPSIPIVPPVVVPIERFSSIRMNTAS